MLSTADAYTVFLSVNQLDSFVYISQANFVFFHTRACCQVFVQLVYFFSVNVLSVIFYIDAQVFILPINRNGNVSFVTVGPQTVMNGIFYNGLNTHFNNAAIIQGFIYIPMEGNGISKSDFYQLSLLFSGMTFSREAIAHSIMLSSGSLVVIC